MLIRAHLTRDQWTKHDIGTHPSSFWSRYSSLAFGWKINELVKDKGRKYALDREETGVRI